MKKHLLPLAFLSISGIARAQTVERQVIGSSGFSYTSSSLEVDYTIGEAVTASGTSGSFSVNQGFQQNTVNSTSIPEHPILVHFNIYPNPVQNVLTLTLRAQEAFELKISIINVAGQIILSDEKEENISDTYKREFSLQQLASGNYFINLYGNKNALLKSIPFVKQ